MGKGKEEGEGHTTQLSGGAWEAAGRSRREHGLRAHLPALHPVSHQLEAFASFFFPPR